MIDEATANVPKMDVLTIIGSAPAIPAICMEMPFESSAIKISAVAAVEMGASRRPDDFLMIRSRPERNMPGRKNARSNAWTVKVVPSSTSAGTDPAIRVGMVLDSQSRPISVVETRRYPPI